MASITRLSSPAASNWKKSTAPTTIGEEMATNPFLRWHDPAIRRNLGMETASDEAVFAEIRKRKDLF